MHAKIYSPFIALTQQFPRLHLNTRTHTHPHIHKRAPGNNIYIIISHCAATVASCLGIPLYYTHRVIYTYRRDLCVPVCMCVVRVRVCVHGHRAWDHPSEPFKADRTHVV